MVIEDARSLDLYTTFGINALAALTTILGGCIVFSNKLLQLASPKCMAVLLSVSGGITLFQTLLMLLAHSFKQFYTAFSCIENDCKFGFKDDNQGTAWLATTGCFIGGIGISYVVDIIIRKLTPGENMNGTARTQPEPLSFEEGTYELKPPVELAQSHGHDVFIKMDEAAKEKLKRMGILSAIAVGIHNIPEGMATFVASSEHGWNGLSLAIGVALHNIAEGVAVATPIYFATGSTCRGLLWCFLSAFAQQLGGLISFAFLGMNAAEGTRGILYGLCAGMMSGISIKEIIPTAFMYANGQLHLVSSGILGGMILMSICLIFFKYIGV
ncbi:hypothetical protein CCR75_006589 [Bremia lactucae]|uniref:Zinc transporter n=1 Tax=Bremia lactucae TaxID=4779 RepID=A0A976FRE3_BRELC|nr:hypothetical protein CCR75_006589 [Bremia lactucae]